MKETFKKVAITGGTHGNELTGVYLIKSFLNNPALVKRNTFETLCLLTNLKAIELCRRYVDKDLNRTFTKDALNDNSLNSYEDILSKDIDKIIGPKNSEKQNADFIIDLHSTTSNMGLSLCISNNDKFTWQVAAYVKEQIPELNIFTWQGDTNDASFVSSIVKSGFTVEVGAVPQGVLKADMYFKTQDIVQKVLDFIELYNNKENKEYKNIEIYNHQKTVDFPRDEKGNITAMIHDDLQVKGYTPVRKGDCLFVDFNGKNILYEDTEELHALFVNEAAYYEKGFAMSLSKKMIRDI